MHPIIRTLGCASALALVFGLASCASSGAGDGTPRFPDPASATLAGGTYPNLDNLRTVSPGMSKDQLYDLIGRPHFGEGVFGVREWDYLFNFGNADGARTTCQFKLQFDEAARVRETHWQPAACASVLQREPPHAGGGDTVTERRAVLSADATFAFGSADLTPLGRRAIDDILTRANAIDGIGLVGHADHIGSDAANDALALRRAETVRDYIAERGVQARTITVESRGSREPVVGACDGLGRVERIACLAPNRRVEVMLRHSAVTTATR